MGRFIVFSDGGAIGNPGPSAIGVIIQKIENGITKKIYSQYIGQATNNQAEYQALIFALKKIRKLFGKKEAKNSDIECYLDSKLLVLQLNGKYKIKEKDLQSLFLELWNLKIDFKSVKFIYIPREKNREADRLVKRELKKALL